MAKAETMKSAVLVFLSLASLAFSMCGGEGATGSCTSKTCSDMRWECGSGVEPSCSATIDCGHCGEGFLCSSHTCSPCTTKTCGQMGWECGSGTESGCNTAIDCGPCGGDFICSNHTCVPPCTTKTCGQMGWDCGSGTESGCSTTIECGPCDGGFDCSDHTCVPSCTTKTCGQMGWECGSGTESGCNTTIGCDPCGGGFSCSDHTCVPSPPCVTADHDYMTENCNGVLCCHDTKCGYGVVRGSRWVCQAKAGDVCFNWADPPAKEPGVVGQFVCCNTSGGTAGTGSLTVFCDTHDLTGCSLMGSYPMCCTQDLECPLGYACTAPLTVADCHCATAPHECARVCLVTGMSALGAKLPCCDGLIQNPYTAICGLPAGAQCYSNIDCASGTCNGDLGGICE